MPVENSALVLTFGGRVELPWSLEGCDGSVNEEAERAALKATKERALADLRDARAALKRGNSGAAEAIKTAKAAVERAAVRIRALENPSPYAEMPPQTHAYVAFLAQHFPRALGLAKPTRPGMPWEPDPDLLAAAEATARELRVADLHSRLMCRRAKTEDLAKDHLRRIARVWATRANLRSGILRGLVADLARAIQQGGRAIGTPKKPHPEDAPMIDAHRLGTPAARLRDLLRLDAERRKARRKAPPPVIVEHFRALERRRPEARDARRADFLSITRAALKATPNKG